MTRALAHPLPEGAPLHKKTVSATQRGGGKFLALLGIRTVDSKEIIRRVNEGLSYTALERLQKRLDVTADEVANVLSIPPRTRARRKTLRRLEPAESDRLIRLTRLYAQSVALFGGDEAEAKEWFRMPQAGLDNRSPFSMAKTEVGAREVEQFIGRLEEGVLP